MNPNTEYELFTQEIYQQLVNSDVVKPTKVEHNIKLKGRSGQEHQIDVYWEYEIAGNKHRVAIECKNYKKSVPIGMVRDFKGLLDDLNGVNGIMVTKEGYQKGAKEYAKEYGISLKELRLPKDGETVIGTIENHFHIEVRHRLFKIDENWANDTGFNLQRYREFHAMFDYKNADKWRSASHLPLETKDNIIIHLNGHQITTLDEIEKSIPDHPTADFPFIIKFDDAYIECRHWGKVKIQEVKYDYDIEDKKLTISLDASNFVKAILKDAISGVIQHIPKAND